MSTLRPRVAQYIITACVVGTTLGGGWRPVWISGIYWATHGSTRPRHYYSIGGIIGAINCRLNGFKYSTRAWCRRFCRGPLEPIDGARNIRPTALSRRWPPRREIFYSSIPDFIEAFFPFLFFFLAKSPRLRHAAGGARERRLTREPFSRITEMSRNSRQANNE